MIIPPRFERFLLPTTVVATGAAMVIARLILDPKRVSRGVTQAKEREFLLTIDEIGVSVPFTHYGEGGWRDHGWGCAWRTALNLFWAMEERLDALGLEVREGSHRPHMGDILRWGGDQTAPDMQPMKRTTWLEPLEIATLFQFWMEERYERSDHLAISERFEPRGFLVGEGSLNELLEKVRSARFLRPDGSLMSPSGFYDRCVKSLDEIATGQVLMAVDDGIYCRNVYAVREGEAFVGEVHATSHRRAEQLSGWWELGKLSKKRPCFLMVALFGGGGDERGDVL